MKHNNVSLDFTERDGILIKGDQFSICMPRQLIITDAFMREVLQPKTKMTEATGLCYLSLLSWRITNTLFQDKFITIGQMETPASKIVFSLMFSSIAGERIMTFDPNFVSNVILENPQDKTPDSMVYTETLCEYIAEDFLTFFNQHLKPLSDKEKRNLVDSVFEKYEQVMKSCVEKGVGITYNSQQLTA